MLKTITFKTHVDDTGILRLNLPVDMAEQDVEVIVTIQPIHTIAETEEVDAFGYPRNFFEETYGSMAHDPIERGDQGTFETRDSLE